MIDKLKNFPLFFISLFPLCLIIGPAVGEVFLILTIIFFFLISSIKEKKEYLSTKFFIFFIICWLYLVIITLFYSIDSMLIIKSILYLRFGLFVISILYFLDKTNDLIQYVFYGVLFSLTLISISGLTELVLNNYFNLINFQISSRISGFFGHEKVMGGYILRLIPLYLALLFYRKNLTSNIYLFLIIFFIFLIFLSNERSAVFLIIILLFLYCLFLKPLRKKILLIFLFCISFFSFLLFEKKGTYEKFINDTFVNQNFYSEAHYDYFNVAFNIGKNNILFGTGYNSFRYSCQKHEYQLDKYKNLSIEKRNNSNCNTHPHNTYLQIFAETGIIGLSIIFFLFFFIIKKLFIYHKYHDHFKEENLIYVKITLLSGFFIFLFPLATTGNFFNNWISMMYYFPLSFLLYFERK